MRRLPKMLKFLTYRMAGLGCCVALACNATACGGAISTSSGDAGDGGDAGADADLSVISCISHPMIGTGTFCHYDLGTPSLIAKAMPNFKDGCTGGPDGTEATYAEAPCPSEGLLGCCVQTEHYDAGSGFVGSCYYTTSTLPDPDASAATCAAQCPPGPEDLKWTTTPTP
jgi:hypothetical protein